MARKKLSEMTPIERVMKRMEGLSWEEAEDVGVEILARCVALHVYAHKDGKSYFDKLMERLCKRGDEWAHEGNNPRLLAFAAVEHEKEVKSNNKEN